MAAQSSPHFADFGERLTADTLRGLLHYDPDTGVFTWRVRRQAIQIGDVAGAFDDRGYARIKVRGRMYLAHRLAWLHVTGTWPAQSIDHINGVKGDNRIANLRDVSARMNAQNIRVPHPTRQHGRMLGTEWVSARKRWRAVIRANGKKTYLGIFSTEQAAHECYVDAKRLMHEGSTL